jgi:hypothetical protein
VVGVAAFTVCDNLSRCSSTLSKQRVLFFNGPQCLGNSDPDAFWLERCCNLTNLVRQHGINLRQTLFTDGIHLGGVSGNQFEA